MRNRFLTALPLLALMAACGASGLTTYVTYESSTAGIQAGSVTVNVRADGLMVSNQTERQVWYFAVNRETLALLDWAPCVMDVCPSLRAGESRLIPWKDVVAYDPAAKEYSFMWWQAEVGPDGTKVPGKMYGVNFSR